MRSVVCVRPGLAGGQQFPPTPFLQVLVSLLLQLEAIRPKTAVREVPGLCSFSLFPHANLLARSYPRSRLALFWSWKRQCKRSTFVAATEQLPATGLDPITDTRSRARTDSSICSFYQYPDSGTTISLINDLTSSSPRLGHSPIFAQARRWGDERNARR
jgi:hypothetical protein